MLVEDSNVCVSFDLPNYELMLTCPKYELMKIWQKTTNVGFGRFPAEVAILLVERTPVHNFAKPNESAKVAKKS